MQSLGCCFFFYSCFSAECSRHQFMWKLHCTRGKKKCLCWCQREVSLKQRERERERRAYRCSRRQGCSRHIRVTTQCARCLGLSPLQFKCLRRLLRSRAASLESREISANGGKKSSQRKIFRKRAPRKHTSPADWWRGWKLDQASVKL